MNNSIDALLELNPLVEGLLRATAILSLACIVHALPRFRNPRWRVLVSRATVLCILALPCMLLFAPTWELAVLPRVESEALASQGEAVRVSVPIRTAAITSQPHQVLPTPEVGRSPARDVPYPLLLIALCASVAAALVLTSMLRYGTTLRRARRGDPAPQAIRDLSARIARDLGLSIQPEVFLDASARVPYVIGCFRPIVVLPAQMATETYAADLPSILSHELVHIQQRDTVWIPLLHLLRQVGWFHPLAWRLHHVHAEACEAVCDARAAQYVGGSERYAGCLARVALELAGVQRRDAMAVPMARSSRVTRRLRDLSRGVGAAALTRGRVWMAILLASAVAFPLVNMKIVRAQDPSTHRGAGTDASRELEAKAEGPESSTERGGGMFFLAQDKEGTRPAAADPSSDGNSSDSGYIEEILESPVGMVFKDVHLTDVLDFVTDTYELNIIVDNRVVPPHDWGGVPGEGNMYVTDGRISFINLRNVTLREAIKAMLRPLGLTYSVQKSFIWVSSPDNVLHETFEELETRSYELSEEELLDLFPAAREEARLSRELEKSFIIEPHQMPGRLQEVMPDIREPVTGQALSSVTYNPLSEQLVIHHTPSTLKEFEGQLRLVQRGYVDFSEPNEEELETRTYTLQLVEMRNLVDGVFESAIYISDGRVRYGIQPNEAEAYVFPDIRISESSEAISWQRFDSPENRLTVRHFPSALDEFERLIREKGWAIESGTK